MKILFNSEATLESLKKAVLSLQTQAKSVMVLGCIDNNYSVSEMNAFLSSCTVEIYGALFPKIIYENATYEKGAIVVGFVHSQNIKLLRDLSDERVDITTFIEEQCLSDEESKSMFVFVDGFAKRISLLIDSLFEVFGLEQNYIGGGAGSLDFIQRECLFTNEGFVQDAAILVQTPKESAIGVQHGWNSIAGPFSVTASKQNVIQELDYRPAFDVYKEVVESHCSCSITPENFFEIAKAYPFGIKKFESEHVVRDPIVSQDGALVCVGDVGQNEYVDILNGTKDTLIEAAKESHTKAIKSFTKEAEVTLFIDCISRVLFLEEDFLQEIAAVKTPGVPLIGALTLGEIANSGNDYLEFYNKTAVVGIL